MTYGLTDSTQLYIHTFNGFQSQCLLWGQTLFFSLLGINLVWLCFKHAVEHRSVSESMPKFIGQFFVISFFYTLMMNVPWLTSMLDSVLMMGQKLNHLPVDPSSLISDGFGLGNQILQPLNKASLLTSGFGVLFVGIVYLIIMFVYISVALDLSLMLITTTALISVSTFFLGFAALGATTHIARQTLDVILINCIKILGIYLVIACGSQTLLTAANTIPTDKISDFEPYWWLVADAGLFWLIVKNLPNQLSRIISGVFQESKGAGVIASTVAAINDTKMAMPAVNLAAATAMGVAKLATSVGANAVVHGMKGASMGGVAAGAVAAVGGSMKDLGAAVKGSVSDHFKSMAGKSFKDSSGQNAIPSVAERMYQGTQKVKTSMGDSSKTSKPSS